VFDRKTTQPLRGFTGLLGLQPRSTEQLVPRLGDYLLAHGYVSPLDLQLALDQKAAQPDALLGQILVDMGLLKRETLDQVIAQQILELQLALLDSNRRLEQRVQERTAELEATLLKLTELNQLKSNIIANISHELRTPLTHVKGYSALLAEGELGPLNAEQRDAFGAVVGAVTRLEQLINDLISYASAARGEITLNLQPVSVAALLLAVEERYKPSALKKMVDFRLETTLAAAAVNADEEKVRWVLLQLADNALKFTEAGGTIVVSARRISDRVVFQVRDDGVGIAPEQVPLIFEEFRQLDGSSTRRYGGTGLGLALAHRILEAHGSRFHVESERGQGSLFEFSLPLCPPAS
jgi:signal transduction histidine kinase